MQNLENYTQKNFRRIKNYNISQSFEKKGFFSIRISQITICMKAKM